MKKLLTLLFLVFTIASYSQDKTNGYQNYTSYATLIGSEDDKKTFIHGFQMEHNYLFNPNFAFGLSTGIEWMDVKMATIGPNIKIILPKNNKQSFFVGASVGAAIALDDEKHEFMEISKTSGGRFVNCELGYVLPTQGSFTLYSAIGYRFQEYSYKIEDWWLRTVERNITYNRFVFKVGIVIGK
ncbi:hypothetical protein [Saccharicrinis sp. GN24d3]|uniref:hypothetical protein n=1 Tax=Saccharicrinis sp. GN24d3 TaxID=3458416 RepID=UPI0040375AEA